MSGDGHYGRAQVMAWREDNGIDYVFGLPGNTVLQRLVDESADDIRIRRALKRKPVLRGYAETRYKAKSWRAGRRTCADRGDRHGLRRTLVVTNLGDVVCSVVDLGRDAIMISLAWRLCRWQ